MRVKNCETFFKKLCQNICNICCAIFGPIIRSCSKCCSSFSCPRRTYYTEDTNSLYDTFNTNDIGDMSDEDIIDLL